MDASAWNEQSRMMVGRAVLAPSSHNTQPWFFQLSNSSVNLYADRTRALPVNDPEDRELVISCGCALLNLRVAAASAGLAVQVQLLPEPGETDLLARMGLAGESNASTGDASLDGFVELRRTYRKRFAPRDVDAAVIRQLLEAAAHEGARLEQLATEAARQTVAALVMQGDAAQWADPSWRRELAAWMHPRRRGDGLTVPSLAAPMAQLVVRTFDMGGGVGAKDRELAEGSPVLAVVCTESDSPKDWLQAGQALQRVLLVACKHGLQASYLNQPIQVQSLRPALKGLLEADGFPQVLLRLGYPVEEIAPAPRRAIEDVIA